MITLFGFLGLLLMIDLLQIEGEPERGRIILTFLIIIVALPLGLFLLYKASRV